MVTMNWIWKRKTFSETGIPDLADNQAIIGFVKDLY